MMLNPFLESKRTRASTVKGQRKASGDAATTCPPRKALPNSADSDGSPFGASSATTKVGLAVAIAPTANVRYLGLGPGGRSSSCGTRCRKPSRLSSKRPSASSMVWLRIPTGPAYPLPRTCFNTLRSSVPTPIGRILRPLASPPMSMPFRLRQRRCGSMSFRASSNRTRWPWP